MDFETRYKGLNELIAIIYGDEVQWNELLREIGFEQGQIDQLRGGAREAVVDDFLEVIHRRLTSDAGRDTYYQILSRRYGLDGKPHAQLSAIAGIHGYTPEYLRQLFEEILQRCRSKSWQTDLKKSLKFSIVAQLGRMNERPTVEHVSEKLERLTSLRGAADVARLNYETKRAEILKQVQAELDALDAEYKPVLDATEENIAALENEIKTDVLLYGDTVTGGSYRASYTQGRVSWDNEGMSKYAASHPEVLQFRKQGQPIVSLRVVNRD